MATRLHTHKADCASVNKAQLAKLPGEESSYTARDAADSDECLRLLRTSCVAPDRLVLKDKAQVVLVKTLDAAQVADPERLCWVGQHLAQRDGSERLKWGGAVVTIRWHRVGGWQKGPGEVGWRIVSWSVWRGAPTTASSPPFRPLSLLCRVWSTAPVAW